jgi:hypothetical protein
MTRHFVRPSQQHQAVNHPIKVESAVNHPDQVESTGWMRQAGGLGRGNTPREPSPLAQFSSGFAGVALLLMFVQTGVGPTLSVQQ